MTEVPLWFLLALLCALFWSIADAFSKRSLREHSAWAVLWVRWGYAIPFLALAVLLRPLPAVDPRSWLVLAVSAPLEITAGLCYLRALQISPLSLTVPLLAWTPVFTALLSFVVLGEVPQKAGFLGIFLVGAGSYVLTWEGKGSPLGPIRALRRERGSLLMLTVALIYSLTSALGKLGVLYSSPVFFGFAYALFVTALYTVVFLLRAGAGACSHGEAQPLVCRPRSRRGTHDALSLHRHRDDAGGLHDFRQAQQSALHCTHRKYLFQRGRNRQEISRGRCDVRRHAPSQFTGVKEEGMRCSNMDGECDFLRPVAIEDRVSITSGRKV